MNWQVLILVSVFFASLSTILQKILLKDNKSDPIAYSIFFQLLTGLVIGVVGLVIGDMSFPNLRPHLFNLVLMTMFYGLGNVFLFKSLKLIDASRFTVLFSSRALFTVLASTLLLSESLGPKQLFGAVLILTSVILVTLKSTKFNLGKGEILGLLAAISFGFANTNDRFLLREFHVYPFVFLAFVVPAFFVLAVNPSSLGKMRVFLDKKILFKMSLLCLIYASSAIAFFWALQVGTNSSQVATINLTNVVLTVLLSAILLKERGDFAKKIIAAVLSFLGLLLVS